MSEKLYCLGEDESYLLGLEMEYSHLKGEILNAMKENLVNEIRIETAMPDKDTEFFFCTKRSECGEKFDEHGNRTCGKECEDYTPRNGKRGCCKYRTACYSPSGEEYVLYENGKLKKINHY